MLASASPRRLDLLRQIGVTPDDVWAPDVDESPHVGETPRRLAARLARSKAAAATQQHPASYVLAADTVVSVGRRILPKAADETEVRACIELLSGRAHRVLTAVAVFAPDGRQSERLAECRLHFKRLTTSDIDRYLASGEGAGKAGGYAVQGRAGAFVMGLQGSYTAVVGLPLYETAALLSGLGFQLP